MRFTYHDIQEDIIKNYNKEKISNLKEEEKTSLVNTFFKFLNSKNPKIEENMLKNIVIFLTIGLPTKNVWLFYKKISELGVNSPKFRYFLELHLNLDKNDSYTKMYYKIIEGNRKRMINQRGNSNEKQR
jgi:hypothetical protein